VASVVATEYDSAWVSVVSYLPAGMVAFARMRENAHFVSDVTAGALLGWNIGRAVAHFNMRLRNGRHVKLRIVPSLDREQRGLVVATGF
jgi:membrane-associated phospholipid phosphatase